MCVALQEILVICILHKAFSSVSKGIQFYMDIWEESRIL
jgi:hypothetical protein